TPPGFDADQRNQPHGFCADLDIMDTWATSSLTPQIATRWAEDDRLFRKIFPMDLRPQGHDIIRTWLFYTALRSLQQDGRAPWRNAALSGFVLDPDRKKMSKSKGNVVTPLPLLERHGADAVRYWAACGRPGTDTAADEGQMKVGRRLAIKIANASKFVLSIIGLEAPTGQQTPVALDLSMLEGLERTLDSATSALEEFDYTRALDVIEHSFWDFCDNYLEIVKVRAYGNSEAPNSTEHSGISSARAALVVALSAYQRAFAPFLPYVSAETWSWWNESSVHRAPWPSGEELRLSYLQFLQGDPSIVQAPTTLFHNESSLYPLARDVISEIRRSKTEAKRSMKTAVERVVFRADEETLRSFGHVQSDLAAAGVVSSFVLEHSDERGIEVTLEAPSPEV
ncbi:MAG: class I tRNA ligase family protein, partial [Acidimicrobiales bacterium]